MKTNTTDQSHMGLPTQHLAELVEYAKNKQSEEFKEYLEEVVQYVYRIENIEL